MSQGPSEPWARTGRKAARIGAKLEQLEPQLVTAPNAQFETAETSAQPGDKLADCVAAQIDQALRQRADDAILRFE